MSKKYETLDIAKKIRNLKKKSLNWNTKLDALRVTSKNTHKSEIKVRVPSTNEIIWFSIFPSSW